MMDKATRCAGNGGVGAGRWMTGAAGAVARLGAAIAGIGGVSGGLGVATVGGETRAGWDGGTDGSLCGAGLGGIAGVRLMANFGLGGAPEDGGVTSGDGVKGAICERGADCLTTSAARGAGNAATGLLCHIGGAGTAGLITGGSHAGPATGAASAAVSMAAAGGAAGRSADALFTDGAW
ncbi:hypothetical protein [Acidisoma silvae]|uniref:Uncharacterized protein n=1 Tax=Acidisoma silvae TaxID=2802396 RepID=A0A964DYA3_9PROT|nr:hypothetical protein [Acidisoma silvae]MCB8874769.1 hypothetical protein [Acidisoma silvae]